MTHRLLRIAYTSLCIGSLSLAGCGGDDDGGDNNPDAGTTGGGFTGTYNHYITSQVKFGKDTSEASSYAFDLDGKGTSKDNIIGGALAGITVATQGSINFDNAIATALGGGQFVVLHSVRSDDATLQSDSTVSWQLYIGAPYTSGMPKFDGSDTPTIMSGTPTNLVVPGSITGGLFCSKPGCSKDGVKGDGKNAGNVTISLSIVEGSDPLTLSLQATRLEAKATPTGCTEGRLGGAIKYTDINNVVLPAVADILDARIKADTGCPYNTAGCDISKCSSQNQTLFSLGLDPDGNCHITASEVQNNSTVKGFVHPDLDLDPAVMGPDNGAAESVSIAIAFTCSKATFTASSEQ